MDLIDRNLVMVDKTSINGIVKSCRVNDMIRAFCIDKAAYKEQNLFQEIKLSKEGGFDPPVSEMHRYHRLSIHSDLSRFLSGKPKGLTVRSFLCFNYQPIHLEANYTIQANIWKMVRLRHLKTKAAIILAVKEEGGTTGENLQTLSRLSPESCTEHMSNKACNLKTWGIRGELATLLNARSIEKMRHLEKLKLVHESASRRKLQLPGRHWFPPGLKRLTLSATFLNFEHISTLRQIDTLEVLKLKNNAFFGISWIAVSDGFHSLQCLLIEGISLAYWEASTDNFPRLRCLVLKKCVELEEIPMCLAENLERLDIEYVGISVIASARKIEEVKNHMQGKQKARLGGFKLSIGPAVCE